MTCSLCDCGLFEAIQHGGKQRPGLNGTATTVEYVVRARRQDTRARAMRRWGLLGMILGANLGIGLGCETGLAYLSPHVRPSLGVAVKLGPGRVSCLLYGRVTVRIDHSA